MYIFLIVISIFNGFISADFFCYINNARAVDIESLVKSELIVNHETLPTIADSVAEQSQCCE